MSSALIDILRNRLGQEVAVIWSCDTSHLTPKDIYHTRILLLKTLRSVKCRDNIMEIEIRKESHNVTRRTINGKTTLIPDPPHVTANFRTATSRQNGTHLPAHLYHVPGKVAILHKAEFYSVEKDRLRPPPPVRCAPRVVRPRNVDACWRKPGVC